MLNKIHRQKLIVFFLFSVGLITAFALIIFSLTRHLNVFVTPTELMMLDQAQKTSFRLGGMVKPGSVKMTGSRELISFVVTDFKKDVPVLYRGLLPDLFREGKGVIVEGRMGPAGYFNASMVLAKHDENYMPKKTDAALRSK